MLGAWKLDGFEWDQGNEQKSALKHGIGRDEIEAFFDQEPAVMADEAHSKAEQRYWAIGTGTNGRWMLVCFTVRRVAHLRFLRPISARYMHRKEVLRYVSDPESAS